MKRVVTRKVPGRDSGNPLVFVDTETTGLDPVRSRPYEIAMIRGTSSGRPCILHLYLAVEEKELDPGKPLEIFLKNRRWLPAPVSAGVAVERIATFTAGAVIVGNNVRSDVAWLERLFAAAGKVPHWHYQLDEVESRAAQRLNAGPPPWSSDDLSRRIGVDPAQFERHSALGDARWSMAQWEVLTGIDLGSSRLGRSGLARERPFRSLG